MDLYLIRHGQTVGNAGGYIQGWTTVDLTDLGRAQAAQAKELIKDITFKKKYASDLQRTRTTASIIFGDDPEIIFDERIRELNNTQLAGRHIKELKDEFGSKFTNAMQTLDYSYFGGESALQLMARAADFLTYIGKECEKEGWENENIAVVTHGGVIQSMLSYILQRANNCKALAISNCSITVLRYSKGNWSVRLVNYTGSLSTLAGAPVSDISAGKSKAELF